MIHLRRARLNRRTRSIHFNRLNAPDLSSKERAAAHTLQLGTGNGTGRRHLHADDDARTHDSWVMNTQWSDLTDEQRTAALLLGFTQATWPGHDHEENDVLHSHDHGDDIPDGHDHGDDVPDDHEHGTSDPNAHAFVWSAFFKTPEPSYTWRAEPTFEGRYWRQSMTLALFDVNSSASLYLFRQEADALLRTCNHTVHTGGALPTPTPDGTCTTMIFPKTTLCCNLEHSILKQRSDL